MQTYTYIGSVSPKGQITIPKSLRKLLGVKPRDKIAFKVERRSVKIVPAGSLVDATYQVVPALPKPVSFRDMSMIAAEEHSEEVAKEGL
ncbi:hypothetical protein HYW54_01870 [Candidatus Gottesmanbacteria bacterium]|nr:hypothetical protein [Candidatus Gottesmanbacteria bacterium]